MLIFCFVELASLASLAENGEMFPRNRVIFPISSTRKSLHAACLTNKPKMASPFPFAIYQRMKSLSSLDSGQMISATYELSSLCASAWNVDPVNSYNCV